MKQMKQIVCVFLALALLVGCVVAFCVAANAANPVEDVNKDGTLPEGATVSTDTAEGFSGGDGTAENPYQIADVTEFRYFQQKVQEDATYLEKSYILTGNIYYNEKLSYLDENGLPKDFTQSSANRFTALGGGDNTTCAVPGTFSGTFDGDGYGIYNIYMRFTKDGAFFETVSGTVKNLNLYGGYVYCANSSRGAASLVATLSDGTVTNCYSSAGIYSNSTTTGGLIGLASGDVTVANCVYAGAISAVNSNASASCGGIVGRLENDEALVSEVIISGCENRAPINSANARVGGIAGFYIGSPNGNNFFAAAPLTFSNCKNTGTITSTAAAGSVAGILGSAGAGANTPFGALTFRNCENTGDVTGANIAGGICGYCHNSRANGITLTGCVNRGTVQSTGDYVGGFVGKLQYKINGCCFEDCMNYGNVTGANRVGGLAGGNASDTYTSVVYSFYNCGSYGAVTGTSMVGGLIGEYHRTSSFTAAPVEGVVIACTVTGETQVGGIIGYQTFLSTKLTYSVALSCKAVAMPVRLVVTTADGTYGTLVGGANNTDATDVMSLTQENTYAYYTVTQKGVPVAAPVPIPGTTAATFENGTGEALTNGTALAALNAYAVSKGYTEWSQASEPRYLIPYEAPVVITNGYALSHPYTGTPVDVAYDAIQDVANVKVFWYAADDLLNPLAACPTDVGSYKVVLKAYDSGNVELGGGREFSAAFEITKAGTSIVPDMTGFTDDGDGTWSATYTGAEMNIPATVVNAGTRTTVSGTPSVTVTCGADAATLKTPGTYTVTLSFSGDNNHQASSLILTVDILKASIAYPENKWIIPNQSGDPVNGVYSVGYTGASQTVTLDADPDLFTVTYSGDFTATNVADALLTATATVALKAEVADFYELTGTAPSYSCTWKIVKGSVELWIIDGAGQRVTLNDMIYDGTEKTYSVIVVDGSGVQVATPANNTITVKDAGDYSYQFSYAGDDNHEAATALTISFTVSPAHLDATQTPLDKVYDGEAVTYAPAFESAPAGSTWETGYTVVLEKKDPATGEYQSATEAVNGGTYRVTLSCRTTDGNYEASVTVDFVISPRAAAVTPPTEGWNRTDDTHFEVTYDGVSHPFLPGTDSDGNITVTYTTADLADSTDAPVNVGGYTVKVSVSATDNYEAATATYTVTVLKKLITLPVSDEELWGYTEAFPYNGASYSVAVSESVLAEISDHVICQYSGVHSASGVAGYTATVTFKLVDPANTAFADGSTEDVVRTLNWEIEPAVLDLSGVVFRDGEKVYNGQTQTLTAVIPAAIKQYLNTPVYSGGGIDASQTPYSVTVTLTLKDEYAGSFILPEIHTFTAKLTIVPTEAVIAADDLTVTYNGNSHTVDMYAADIYGTDFTDYVTLVITKDGREISADDVKDAGTYLFTFTFASDGNVFGEERVATLEVKKAKYTSGGITVSGDTTFIADGGNHDISLNVTMSGADGLVRVDETRLPTIPTEPGTYTLIYHLIGSPNYEDPGDYTVDVTVLKSGIADTEKGVEVSFAQGAPGDVALTVSEKETDETLQALIESLALPEAITNPKLGALYLYTFADGDGNEVTLSDLGTVTVTVTLPEKYQGYESIEELLENISFITATYKSNGDVNKVTLVKKSALTYDPELGTVSFRLESTSTAYGYVVNQNLLPLCIGIGVGGVALIAVIVFVIVKLVGAWKRKHPKDPEETKEEPLPPTWDDTDAAPAEGWELEEERTTERPPVFGQTAETPVTSGDGGAIQDPRNKNSFGFGVLGFFFPLVGLILFLVWKKELPKRAKSVGIGALIGAFVEAALIIIAEAVTILLLLMSSEYLSEAYGMALTLLR